MVEAILVEVSSDRAAELGVTWAVGDADLDNAIGITKFDNTTGVTGIAGAILSGGGESGGVTAAAGGLIGSGLTLGVGSISDSGLSFVALIEALEADGSSNIIGTPVLVTLDNEEAEIVVGQEVPFVTGQYTDTGATGGVGGNVNPFQTIQREQVGLTLKLTPQINEGNAVRLKVEQEISSLLPSTQAVDLITQNRSINTVVIVEDRATLVLGGLIQEQVTERQQRVPLLGRIPLLGALFRSDNTTKNKTNLMVFIKPTILRDNAQATFETNTKYTYLRDQQLGIKPRNPRLMPMTDRPILPELEQPPVSPDPAPIDLREPPKAPPGESTGS
jgi:general secretion pathway protein D